MEITSPINLWRGYDVSALPLNEYALSDKQEGDIHIREYYFDGFATVDGRVRAYIKFYENVSSKGVILYLGDNYRTHDKLLIQDLIAAGYTVAVLDYLGASDEMPRFTFYPQSLSDCNCRSISKFAAPDDALKNCWYVWTCIAQKSVKLIETLYPDQKIFAVGNGLGGSTVYKLAALNNGLSACATLLNILPEVQGSDDGMILYRAALDVNAYAPLTKLPMFMAVASNDEDGSLDDMAELAKTTASLKCLRIVERAFSRGVYVTSAEIDKFFSTYAQAENFTHRPSIKAVNSENKLYININIHNDEGETPYAHEVAGVELFTSFSVENAAHRNWSNGSILGLGGNEYMAHIDVLHSEKPAYAFVNVTYANGTVQSSDLITVVPKTLGIPSQPAVWQRLIYDGSMGKDVWTSPDGGNVENTNGLFGIDGVKSDTNTLATFKVGDPLYSAPSGTLLQILISGKVGSVTISVLDDDDYYKCNVDIPSEDAWHKFTLSHLDFKSANGPLPDWSRIVMLELTAESEFTISSVLWV